MTKMTKCKVCTISITKQLYDLLALIIEKDEMFSSRSEFIRTSILHYLETYFEKIVKPMDIIDTNFKCISIQKYNEMQKTN